MNKIEKTIYDLVKRNPNIKFFLRDTYQLICDIIPTKSKVTNHTIITREGYFFGFHDKCPFSGDDSKLLGGKFDIPLRSPKSEEHLTVGYFNGDNYKNYNPISKTRSWNWHQGCHLQWRGLSNEIVFNDFDGENNIARVINTETGSEKTLSRAIASVSPDGTWAAGYSFERVQKYMPGYGYLHGSGVDVNKPITDKDGLYKVDMETGVSELIVSIAQVAGIDADESMNGGKHYISHAIIAPGSKRVMFLHRWVKEDKRKRWSRMFACDMDGGNLYRFPTSEMVSHMGWRNEEQIIAYCRLEDGKDGYVLFDDQKKEGIQRIGSNHFSSDGHPSYEKSERWIITDTYPDRFRQQSLILYDTLNNERHNIAKLKQQKRFADGDIDMHWTCDLHPRWNRAGTMVCFDSTFPDERSLCTMDVSSIIK